MVKVFRCAILVAVVSAAVAIFLPGVTTRIEVALPAPGARFAAKDLALLVGVLATGGAFAAMALTAISAAGLLRFKHWARPMAIWGTIMLACCVAASALWSPVPITPVMTRAHTMLLAAATAAWTLVLVLLHSASVRARFTRRTTS